MLVCKIYDKEYLTIKGRYYWLKLKKDFFAQKETVLIRRCLFGNGILLFYIKLLLEAIEREGKLRINEDLPFSARELARFTATNLWFTRYALRVLHRYRVVETAEDGTLVFPRLASMVGSETSDAERMRRKRAAEKQIAVLEPMQGQLGRGVVFLTREQDDKLLELMPLETYHRYVSRLADFIINRNANVKNHYQTILQWYRQDTAT